MNHHLVLKEDQIKSVKAMEVYTLPRSFIIYAIFLKFIFDLKTANTIEDNDKGLKLTI